MLGASLPGHVLHKVFKGVQMSHDTFERMGFEDLVVMEDLHLAQRERQC